jgi:hypothetical protein
MTDIVQELRSNAQLPVCPYDRRSPDYWTAPNDKPCAICGTLNDPDAPDKCRGADTRVMERAADEIERLETFVEFVLLWMTRERVTDAERVSVVKYHPHLQDMIEARASIATGKGGS